MKISSQSWPNITVADSNGTPVPGVSESTAERYALEKILELPAGEYRILRPDATVVTEAHEAEQPVEEPEEPTDPEPDPEPEPEPDPVDPSERPEPVIQTLNPSATISFSDHHDGGSAYVRSQKVTILKQGDTLKVVLLDGRNGNIAFSGSEYTLYFNGSPVDTKTPDGELLTFEPDTSSIDEGWYIASTTEHGEETCCKYPVFVYKDGTAQIDWMPSWTDSYTQSSNPGTNKIYWVPTQFEPIAKPLSERVTPDFDYVPNRSDMWTEMLTGELSNYSRRPNVTKEGVLTTANNQWYTWWDFTAQVPNFPLLDGMPGENSFASATHIQVGNARLEDDPDSPLMGNIYVGDPWRICRLAPNGRLTTLIGWVHEDLPSYYRDPHNLTLRGDWSAVPEERRGLWEQWGWGWLASTLAVDHTADPIPEEDNRIPHETGPTMVVANTQHGSVLGVRFDPAAHDKEAVVWEIWHEDGAEPWDVRTRGDEIYVSDRTNHRIIQLDAQGNLIRTVVQGADLAYVNDSRFVYRSAGVSTIRAEDCVLPEGLDIVDDWLYFGSAAMGQVKRVHLDDGTIEVIWSSSSTSSSKAANYYKIAISDGTAFPKGTLFLSTWSVFRYGGPLTILPGGSVHELFRADLTYRMPRGRASTTMSPMSYNTAVAAKHGRLIFGSVNSGLRQMTIAQEDDPSYDRNRYLNGKNLYNQMGGPYRWGAFGQSFYGDPLPWGEHEDIDYFLEVVGCKSTE